jgi:hypothetical protein
MTHSWVDLSVIVPENRRVTHAGLTGFDWYRSEHNPTGYNSVGNLIYDKLSQWHFI